MSITSLFQQLFISFLVLTSMGTLVHDTKLNKALESSLPANISINTASHLDSLNEGSSHTHVEKASFAQSFGGIPRVQPRDDHRRYVTPKYLAKTNPYFGGSQILWPSV